jgi:hypothetical protein
MIIEILNFPATKWNKPVVIGWFCARWKQARCGEDVKLRLAGLAHVQNLPIMYDAIC